MRYSRFALLAVLGVGALVTAPSFVRADDDEGKNEGKKDDGMGAGKEAARPDDPAARAGADVLVFGDGAAKFNVRRDEAAGKVTFTLADPSVRIASAPVVVLQTDSGPREVTLTPAGTGAWVLTDDLVRSGRLDGTMRVVVAGQTYTTPLMTTTTTTTTTTRVVARHGGRVVAFPECKANVEIVQDAATGALTIYSFEDVQILEAPVVTITDSKGPVTLTVTKVEGQPGAWVAKHEVLKRAAIDGRIRLMVNGHPCETSLRGGRIIKVEGGPSFEVVSEQPGEFVFYAVDETISGKPYTIEDPAVVVTTAEGPRTIELVPVEGQPRAWRLVGFDADMQPTDANLQFTLFGKTLHTNVGLSGLGIGIR
jgi:hypothetical protein